MLIAIFAIAVVPGSLTAVVMAENDAGVTEIKIGVTAKENGTAKMAIRAKYKKKKLETWIKIKVKIDNSGDAPQNQPAEPTKQQSGGEEDGLAQSIDGTIVECNTA